MYIVRWLIGHPIIAAWVLIAIAILLNFGMERNGDHTNFENSKGKINESINTDITEDKATVTKAVVDDALPKGSSLLPTVTESNNNTKEEIVTTITTKGSKSVADNSLVTMDADSHSIDSAAISDLRQMSSEEVLKMAREAYWNNGLDEAAQIYKELIKLEPKAFEYRGELGNVYWRQGYPKKAAELYSEIALPMIEKGNSERAANMVGFIGLYYPERAAAIKKRLELIQKGKGQ